MVHRRRAQHAPAAVIVELLLCIKALTFAVYMSQVLKIKNMVCARCVKVVREELEALGLELTDIKLGEVTVAGQPDEEKLKAIKDTLQANGFELLEDPKAKLIDGIKTLLIDLIHHKDLEELQINYSDYLSEKLGKDYSYLSHLFSSTENITIEKYIILQKIERAKELIVYDELSLSEIAYKLAYSSVAHFSNQFKQVTGQTPSAFKKQSSIARKELDKIGRNSA